MMRIRSLYSTKIAVGLALISKRYSSALRVAVISGSSRREGPPRPINGPRVTKFIAARLKELGHEVTVIDPVEINLPLLEKPEFAYTRSMVPPELSSLREILEKSNAYVAVTPEYNHAPSPALLNILNHFGSSVFSFKPSAIVSYSAGQWGGTRAAVALRPVLSELGCLPVSAMIHIPKAQDVFDEDGKVVKQEDAKGWDDYTFRCFSQLEWWGEAALKHREVVDPHHKSPPLKKDPSQRNAPTG